MRPPARLAAALGLTLRLTLGLALGACGGGGADPVQPPPAPPAPPPAPPVAGPTTPALPAGVHALAGLAETLPDTDLEPLREIVGDAQVVALGESTHASRGYYLAKGRLIRFLVERMGFRVIAWETPWLDGAAAARYVASCAGTPEAAMAGMFRVWHDASVRDLLRWTCEWNRARPGDPVTFFGFDVQDPWKTGPAARAFVQRAAPAQLARADGLLRCLGAAHASDEWFRSQQYRDHVQGRRDAAAHDACLGAIADVEAYLAATLPALERATSAAEVEEARIALVSLRAWEQQLWVPDPGGYQARDQGMAELFRRLLALRAPGKRAVIWAWNWHIARRYEEVRGFDDDSLRAVPRQGARAMGSFLHEALGAAYLPIGLVGHRVEINSGGVAPPLQTHPLSVERRLQALGRGYLLVDLRRPLADSLLPAGRRLQVSQEWGDPYRQFGALVFLEHSPPMTYVPVP